MKPCEWHDVKSFLHDCRGVPGWDVRLIALQCFCEYISDVRFSYDFRLVSRQSVS